MNSIAFGAHCVKTDENMRKLSATEMYACRVSASNRQTQRSAFSSPDEFLVGTVCDFFVYEISREPLNGFAPNSHGRRVWSLVRTSLKVKVKE